MRCASSAVHSMRCVGLLMGMMMGCSWCSPINRSTFSVNSRPAPDSPIIPVGFACPGEHTAHTKMTSSQQVLRKSCHHAIEHSITVMFSVLEVRTSTSSMRL